MSSVVATELRRRLSSLSTAGSRAVASVSQFLAHVLVSRPSRKDLQDIAVELSNALANLRSQGEASEFGREDEKHFVEGALFGMVELATALLSRPMVSDEVSTPLPSGVRDRVLAFLATGEARPSRLADDARIQRSQVSRALAELLEAGLVQPVEVELSDGRARWYQLTAAGERHLERVEDRVGVPIHV